MYGFDKCPFEQASECQFLGAVSGFLGLGGGKGGSKAFDPEAIDKIRGTIQDDRFTIGGGDAFRGRQQQAFNRAPTAFADPNARDTNQFISSLQGQMAGTGPSLAQTQFANALEQGIASQQAQAATGGFDPAARRIAAQNVGALTQGAARGSAEIRAQEQFAAQQQLAQALQARQADQLQRAQQSENLRLQYESLGFDREQAESLAQQNLENLVFNTAVNQANVLEAGASRNQKGIGGLLGGVAGVAASGVGEGGLFTKSDMNMKENIQSGDDPVEDFLNKISAYQYDYKDGSGDDRVGVMAQDLEKSPVTQQMVKDTPEGKMVDYGQGFSAMMAALANLNDRINRVEGK